MKRKHDVKGHSLPDTLEAIGKKLTELRLGKGYTSHATFAADFDLPPIQYWRMEKGRANMTLKSLHKVLSIHGLSIEMFFNHTTMHGNQLLGDK